MKNMQIKLLTLLSTALFTCGGIAHECEKNNYEWGQGDEYSRVVRGLASLFQCIDTKNKSEYKLRDRTACNWFTSKAIEQLYGKHEFKHGDAYMTANQIANALFDETIVGWKNLGSADKQSVLTLGGSLVEQGKPVIAAWNNESGHGHVTILIPGGLWHSPKWGLDVPNSANMRLDKINSSFIGCPLANAFGADKKSTVVLYTTR